MGRCVLRTPVFLHLSQQKYGCKRAFSNVRRALRCQHDCAELVRRPVQTPLASLTRQMTLVKAKPPYPGSKQCRQGNRATPKARCCSQLHTAFSIATSVFFCFAMAWKAWHGCSQGLLGPADVLEDKVEIIRPDGQACQAEATEPAVVKMRAGDGMFGMMPLPFATYPAIVMRYSSLDVAQLKKSLGQALRDVPMIAGRLRPQSDDPSSYEVVLNGEGVPFLVVQRSEKKAPEFVEEYKLPDFAWYCRPPSVRAGREPLMTVKVTMYQDGSGLLAFCRSHMLFDGSSAWTFLSFWASLARGEAAKAPWSGREKMYDLIPDEGMVQQLAQKEIGKELTQSWLMGMVGKILVPVLAPVVDTLFLHTRMGLDRHRIYFSDEELAAIKEEATPTAVKPGQDSWVTTQEAFCAYLLMTLGKHILAPDAKGTVQMMFLLDARKALGLPANQLMGGGLTFTSVMVQDMKALTLPEIASKLHEALARGEGSLEAQKARWQLLNGACEKKLEHSLMQEFHYKRGVDMKLAVNNSSKRPLLDFGRGPAESVVSDAGPSLLLPAKGGLYLYLDQQVFTSAKCSCKEKRSKALEALRADLPKKGVKRKADS